MAQGKIKAIVCFSHLRWRFVYQRPQHLLTRANRIVPVHFWEEPEFQDRSTAELAMTVASDGLRILTPLLPRGSSQDQVIEQQRLLLDEYVKREGLREICAWYYTPMALSFTGDLRPAVIVYDCMDELSAFQGAPPELVEQELHLFDKADVVFTGGASLFSSKRSQHTNVHFFPSSVDRQHFAVAQKSMDNPADQAGIPYPRIGFYGVLDERLDRQLLASVASTHPEWHFVLVGPLAKVREDELPHGPNLHYLGQKSYAELPSYLANWQVAMLPFARNTSTRFISPTKTPEYLAAHKPVVSTPIRDVVTPYGDSGLVRIAGTAEEFSAAIQESFTPLDQAWVERVNDMLAGMSWDQTFASMWAHIQECFASRQEFSECLAAR